MERPKTAAQTVQIRMGEDFGIALVLCCYSRRVEEGGSRENNSSCLRHIMARQLADAMHTRARPLVSEDGSGQIAPCEADMRPQGWLISVKSPEDIRVDLYATVADTLEHAEVLVGNHCAVSTARIRYERI